MVNVVPDDTDFSAYVDKEIGEVTQEFLDWLRDKVPYSKLDDRSVFLALRLYGYFQRSESHQDNLARKARGDSSPPRPSPKKGPGAKPKAAPARGKPAAATSSTTKTAAKTATAKATPAKATAPKRGAAKRGAAAPY
jgi:hypothetical protein